MYPVEVRERAVRLVLEHMGEYPSQWAAITSIAMKCGTTPTSRTYCSPCSARIARVECPVRARNGANRMALRPRTARADRTILNGRRKGRTTISTSNQCRRRYAARAGARYVLTPSSSAKMAQIVHSATRKASSAWPERSSSKGARSNGSMARRAPASGLRWRAPPHRKRAAGAQCSCSAPDSLLYGHSRWYVRKSFARVSARLLEPPSSSLLSRPSIPTDARNLRTARRSPLTLTLSPHGKQEGARSAKAAEGQRHRRAAQEAGRGHGQNYGSGLAPLPGSRPRGPL